MPIPPDEPAKTTQKPPKTPRWVGATGAIAGVIVLLILIVMLLSGVDHGPQQHGSSINHDVHDRVSHSFPATDQ